MKNSRTIKSAAKKYRYVQCPDSGRLMWFEDDRTGRIEANRVFCDFVEISMCDSVAEKEKN